MLSDANVLVAILMRRDQSHARCLKTLASLPKPLITTWPCIAEAMYLLHQYGGHPAQDKLWELIADGTLQIHLNSPTELDRMRVLMRQYSDTPLDLADESLIAAAETLGQTRIFTLDSDFFVYRLQNGTSLEIVP